MKAIFSDMEIIALETDDQAPGVLVKAKKPSGPFEENDLSEHALYSMVTLQRSRSIDFTRLEYTRMRLRNSFVVRKFEAASNKLFGRS